MTGFLGTVAALALVLGLILVVARVAGRLGSRAGLAPAADLAVEARAGIAPRQGVAVVRAEGKRLLVGYGEGGVRLVAELDDPAPGRHAAGDPGAGIGGGDAPALPLRPAAGERRTVRPGTPLALVERVRSALRAGALGVALVLASAAPGAVPALAAAEAGTGAATEAVEAPATPAAALPQEAPGGAAPATPAQAPRMPELNLRIGDGEGEPLELSGPVGIVVVMGVLTLLPTLLLLMTSFTRILVVLHLLKQAIGTQTAPPSHLLAAMALLLTGFVMAPTLSEANRTAVDPWLRGELTEGEMLTRAALPFRDFMLHTTREEDLASFMEMSRMEAPTTVDDIPTVVLASAFVTSELRAAFQMGFALFLPFVVIDLVVASVLMSMGMFMLPPVMVSLPFKLLLFVLVDGWSLVVESLVQSFR